MIDVQKKALQAMQETGRRAIIGCEAAAAEPYISYLLFNDARFNINLMVGTPVPAYAYVYHEYVNNFMGNQNSARGAVDFAQSPLNLHQRIAFAFIAGDLLTVVLKSRGEIAWDWGTPWNEAPPEQESVSALVRNLNAWRRGAAKPWLLHGRMEKPREIRGASDIPMITPRGKRIPFKSVCTSLWTHEGRRAQVLANYTKVAQDVTLVCPDLAGGSVGVCDDPTGRGADRPVPANGLLPLSIKPLSALLIVSH